MRQRQNRAREKQGHSGSHFQAKRIQNFQPPVGNSVCQSKGKITDICWEP